MDLEVAFNNSQCKVKANMVNLVRTNNNRWAALAVSSSNQWVNMVPLTLTWTWASNNSQWAWVVEIISLILEVHPVVNQLGKTHLTPSAEQTTTWVASDNSNSSHQPRTRARLSTCSEECHQQQILLWQYSKINKTKPKEYELLLFRKGSKVSYIKTIAIYNIII